MNRVHRRRIVESRRGVALVMVMSLLAITFAVAFTMSRTQLSTIQLQGNAALEVQAREAALTGYRAGLRKLHESSWGGVNSTLANAIRTTQSYSVSYTHGDPRLPTNDSKQPYRVTMLVTGTATDPARAGVSATSQIRAIVELLPRKVSDAPATYSTSLGYTLYQFAQDTVDMQPPCQVQGSVRLLNTLSLGTSYFNSTSERNRYYADLNTLRTLGNPDYRPLQGPIHLPESLVSATVLDRLQNKLGCTTVNIATGDATNWSYPGAATTYKLYPGGKTYNAQAVGSFLQNTTLEADPETNPLGIFYRNGSVQICDNVTIRGTLMCNDVLVCGNPCSITAVSLPAIDGSSLPVQLPAIISADDLEVEEHSNLTIRGSVVLWDDLNITYGSYNTTVDIQGRVLCKGVYFSARSQWNVGGFIWDWLYNTLLGLSGTQYYPNFLSAYGLSSVPKLTIKPESTAVQYVWKNSDNQVYMPHSSDPGLRWSVVDYNDHF
ncbi:MAG: hypothetical protein JNM18_20550 [Planctomycetaceae bacterium]|nr:hypothetical protein [Planctomycetaceae bacterium]